MCAQPSPGGRYLAAGYENGEVYIWMMDKEKTPAFTWEMPLPPFTHISAQPPVENNPAIRLGGLGSTPSYLNPKQSRDSIARCCLST